MVFWTLSVPCSAVSLGCLDVDYFYSYCLLLEVYIFFKLRIHVLYQFWKILSHISSRSPYLYSLSSLQLELQNAGLSPSLLSLLGSHFSSLYLPVLYLGHFPQIRFSNPLALLINLSAEVLISMTTCFSSRSSIGSFSDLRVFFCSVLFSHYEF